MGSPSITTIAGFEKKLIVGVGGLAVSNNQAIILTTYSLGSCLGVTIYDPVCRSGGMLHAMLPDSAINAAKAAEKPGMFVDTGMVALLHGILALKAAKGRMQICVVGGAQFLDTTGYFNIGQRNYASLTKLLGQEGLAVDAKDVGGKVSRTLTLDMHNGEVRVKSSGQSEETVLFKSYANIG